MVVHKIDYGQRVYKGTLDAANKVITATMLVIDSYNGETIGEPWISDRDEYAAGATPSTGAQVAYTLATPLEIPVTVPNSPIRTLSGYNHIESSTGDVEVEYITKTYEPIIKAAEKELGEHYSTSERVVGTWIDGKTLYEKIVVNSSTLVAGNNLISIPTDASLIISATGVGVFGDGTYSIPLNYEAQATSTTLALDELNGTPHTVRVRIGSDFSSLLTGAKVYITIRYTKNA